MARKVALRKTPSACLNFILSFDYLGFFFSFYSSSGTSKGTCRRLCHLRLSRCRQMKGWLTKGCVATRLFVRACLRGRAPGQAKPATRTALAGCCHHLQPFASPPPAFHTDPLPADVRVHPPRLMRCMQRCVHAPRRVGVPLIMIVEMIRERGLINAAVSKL